MIRCVVGVVWRTAWEGSESNMCEVNWTENRREWNSISKRELSWAFISVCLLMCHQDYSPDEKGHIYVFCNTHAQKLFKIRIWNAYKDIHYTSTCGVAAKYLTFVETTWMCY